MRLAARPFLTSVLVIVMLAVVGFLCFHAVGKLVSVNREIATRTVPAVHLTASTREAIAPLVRFEMRAVVLGDTRYATAWTERASRVAEDLEKLAGYVQSEQEAVKLGAAHAAFDGYRRIVTQEQALVRSGDRARALHLTDAEAQPLAEEVRRAWTG